NPAGNMSWLQLRQEIDGIPVFQGELTAAFTADGALVQTTSNLAPVIDSPSGGVSTQAATAAQSATAAVVSSANTIGVALKATDLTLKESSPNGTRFVFGNNAFTEDINVEAIYFPVEQGSLTKAWSMVLWEDNPAYYTIVSANDGALLWRKNITNDQ